MAGMGRHLGLIRFRLLQRRGHAAPGPLGSLSSSLSLVTVAAALLGTTSWLAPAAVQAATASRFVCSNVSGVPTTEALTRDGRRVPVIRWTSRVFSGSGWTSQRRCQEVSARFEQFRRQGRLRYITTGRMRGQPVLCTAYSSQGACDGLLYTLKPGQDPSATLARLLELRVKARGPLNETGPRLYVSVDLLLQEPGLRQVEPSVADAPLPERRDPAATTAPPAAPLW